MFNTNVAPTSDWFRSSGRPIGTLEENMDEAQKWPIGNINTHLLSLQPGFC